jgi:hypothetical protein
MRAHLFSDFTRTSFETKLKKGTAKALQGQLARPKKKRQREQEGYKAKDTRKQGERDRLRR